MIAMQRLPCRLLLAAMALGVVGTGHPSQAQDEDDLIEDAPAQEQVVRLERVAMSEENFNQWVFGGRGDAATVRGRLDTLLALRVEEIDRICGTTEAQEKKLRLAGRGDIKRFFDRVEEKRRKFQLVKHDQNRINEIFQELQPLQMALNAQPYGEGSIFFKTIKKTLDGGQAAKFDEAHGERVRLQYRAKVGLVVEMLDSNLGLTAEQRRNLGALILEETKPPKKFGQYDFYVVMLQAGKISEDKLKPIFDDAQWRLWKRLTGQWRGIEAFLKQGGFLPDEAPPKPK